MKYYCNWCGYDYDVDDDIIICTCCGSQSIEVIDD